MKYIKYIKKKFRETVTYFRIGGEKMRGPMFKDWELYFPQDEGYENPLKVARAFAQFLAQGKVSLFVPGKCILGGHVRGDGTYHDGDEIFSAYVTSFSCLEWGYKDGARHNLLLATTASGSTYYLYSGQMGMETKQLLEDAMTMGGYPERSGYYLNRRRWSNRLI